MAAHTSLLLRASSPARLAWIPAPRPFPAVTTPLLEKETGTPWLRRQRRRPSFRQRSTAPPPQQRRHLHVSADVAVGVHSPSEASKRADEIQRLTIAQPDDWHLHLRDGASLASVVYHSANVFRRAIIMPNLRPPVTTTAMAVAYQGQIREALPPDSSFQPLMTLYLTDNTSAEDVREAKQSGAVHALKLYPAGATTNSDAGVTDLFGRCRPALEAMVEVGLPLLVHGEVTDASVDMFDRERVFLERVLSPLREKLPELRVVLEHVTTADAVDFVLSGPEGRIAATVTPQHMLLNRNALFQGGLRPHAFCLPVLKRESHRQAILRAVTGGSRRFFLGTDSAPHERRAKEAPCGCAGIFSAPAALPLYARAFDEAGALDKLEAFASFNGPDFYGMPRNTTTVTLVRKPWVVPASFDFGSGTVVPMAAGETLEWALE